MTPDVLDWIVGLFMSLNQILKEVLSYLFEGSKSASPLISQENMADIQKSKKQSNIWFHFV